MENRRKNIRFQPSGNTLAQIDASAGRTDAGFHPTLTGIVYEEGAKGCGIIALKSDALGTGSRCSIKVGDLGVLKAEVRWRKDLDEHAMKVGFLYLD